MRRFLIVLAVASCFTAAANANPFNHHRPAPQRCRVSQFRAFSARVWDTDRWQRGKPRHVAIRAAHRRLDCVGGRSTERRIWAKDRLSYGRYRELRQVAPYPGFVGRGLAESWLAIPRYIVECESGGDWFAVNPSGAAYLYQLLGWGAPYPDTWQAKMANHRIAARVWAGGAGASNWACA